jgi:hypothetical protein
MSCSIAGLTVWHTAVRGHCFLRNTASTPAVCFLALCITIAVSTVTVYVLLTFSNDLAFVNLQRRQCTKGLWRWRQQLLPIVALVTTSTARYV